MKNVLSHGGRPVVWAVTLCLAFWPMVGALVGPGVALAQDAAGAKAADAVPERELSPEEAARKAEEDLARAEPTDGKASTEILSDDGAKINILALLVKGGHLMWPIAAMSLVVVTFGTERILGLRRRKVLPPELIDGLGRLADEPGGFDPRKAYALCKRYPSAAANVVRAMLLKIGRPHAELENAVAEADRREAARLYTNVRWLGLAAGVTPLLGLLGTVWGMIQAFFATANLPTGANKAEALAQGIYQALVTTFAGLAVAIPAAVLAHILEGQIQKVFRELDETLLGLMPRLERFEGRLRVRHDSVGQIVSEPLGGDNPPRPVVPSEKNRAHPDPTPQ